MSQKHAWIERAQAHGEAALLDSNVRVSKIDLRVAAPNSCGNHVWIEVDCAQ